MKPSPEARDLLGYTWRERMNRWIERNWWWISAIMLLALYLLLSWFDQRDRESSLYQRIERQQAQIEQQQLAAEYRQPVYFLIEAKTPTEGARKLMEISTAVEVQRIHAMNAVDTERKLK